MSAPVFNQSCQHCFSNYKRAPKTIILIMVDSSIYKESISISTMGRARRKRKRRRICCEQDFSKITQLQKTLKLKCPKIQISYFDGIGWGVRCKKKIEEGDDLISLPLQHLITVDVNCEIFNILQLENQTPQFLLSIFTCYESHLGEKSKFFEYIGSLPKSFANPYFCTVDEINLLPEFIRKEVIAQTLLINSKVEELLKIVNDKTCPHCGLNLTNVFTSEKFVWAWFVVNTRSVYYQDHKQTKSLALAPFLDLFNHSNDALTKLFIDFDNGLYTLRTMIRYKKFEQVFIKYGAHNNLKLFLEYGFILPDNDNDFVEFSFEEVIESVREFDFNFGEMTKLKYNFIKSNKLNENLTKSSEFSWNFQGLVYVLITADQDLSVLRAKTYSNSFSYSERNAIEKIGEIITNKKFEELNGSLTKLENIRDSTESFKLAKNLIKTYMKLLPKK